MGPGVGTKPYWGTTRELTGGTLAPSVLMPSLATVKMLPVMPPGGTSVGALITLLPRRGQTAPCAN